MAAGDEVRIQPGRPEDYHCNCEYCKKYFGELRPADGSYYSRLERNAYYSPTERGFGHEKKAHIAKTPLHIARWAIQQYTRQGDWVLDPTIGAGTTAVEALTQGRNVAGMELEFGHVVEANIKRAMEDPRSEGVEAVFARGDARNIEGFLSEELGKEEFALVVNNPPYSGDVSMPNKKQDERGQQFTYDKDLPNLAHLREGQEYWDTMREIYSASIRRLRPGGHFVVGVKDMVRKKEPFLLHKMFCDLLSDGMGMEFAGTALLKHYPGTLFLNSYEKRFGRRPPLYQTISVFRKV